MNLWPFMKLALPGMLMLVLENLNMEILVFLAGIMGDTKMLAAQVILIAIGQFAIEIPYGLALGAVSMIGHSLGANEPKEAAFNSKIISLMTVTFCVLTVSILILSRETILSLFTDDAAVIEIAKDSYIVFMVAFSFDWM